jgi:NAD(P)H-flavin reductase
MFFLIDKKRKIIIGWSAKCGCTHIKKIIKYLNNSNYLKNNVIHLGTYRKLPEDFLQYNQIIIITRNPYERLISGFNNKYKANGSYRKLWKKKEELTFKNFVDELILNKYTNVEKHHFTPQTSEEWNDNI